MALSDELLVERLDRGTIAALWVIGHLARVWGLEPEGMLQRNKLITATDVERLATWIDCISYATMCLLDGMGLKNALEEYQRLLAKGLEIPHPG